MNENISKVRVYYYLFVVFLLIVFSIYYAFKQSSDAHENYTIVMNEKVFYPPDIIPHIRELQEDEKRPSNMDRDEWEDYKRDRDELNNIS